MTVAAVLAAVSAGSLVGAVSYRLIRPPKRIGRQVAPYTAVARSYLGVDVESIPEPLFSGEVVRRVLGPLSAGVTNRLSRVLGVSDRTALDLKLRQAGQPMTADEYRRRHLQYIVAAPVASALVATLFGSTFLVVAFMAAGGFAGSRLMPDHLKRLTRRRATRIRSDLPTVAWMLTPRIRNRMTVVVAVGDLVRQGSGPVIADLARALALIRTGLSEQAAFQQIAKETTEESAARFYTVLAGAATGSIDLAPALIELARELRTQRREEVETSAAKRQIAMVIPDLVFMAPILFVFILAPIPRLLFGARF